MSYADRVQNNERPSCWGNSASYSTQDDECDSCRYQHTCRAEVMRKGAAPSVVPLRRPEPSASSQNTYRPSYRPSYRPEGHRRNAELEIGVEWAPGLTYEGENPWTRFGKDVLAGMARGGLFEGYRFFTNHRIP